MSADLTPCACADCRITCAQVIKGFAKFSATPAYMVRISPSSVDVPLLCFQLRLIPSVTRRGHAAQDCIQTLAADVSGIAALQVYN